MHDQLFVPDFLFDFYTNTGSIGTALSNVSRSGLGKFRAKPTKCRFCVFSHVWSPLTVKLENLEKQFSAVW